LIAAVNETVLAAKEFLDGELAKYETWADIRSDISIRTNLGIQNGQAFAKLKGSGVGRDTIKDFLGGNWKGWVIQEAPRNRGHQTPQNRRTKANRYQSTLIKQSFLFSLDSGPDMVIISLTINMNQLQKTITELAAFSENPT
jgi:hypothetical protein